MGLISHEGFSLFDASNSPHLLYRHDDIAPEEARKMAAAHMGAMTAALVMHTSFQYASRQEARHSALATIFHDAHSYYR